VRAKPAVPLAGQPLVSRILRYVSRFDVRDCVLNLHHLPETITARVGDGSDLGVQVRYSWEGPRVLGSAGGPRKALPLVGDADFFIVNGDTLCDVDLKALAAQHAATGALVTMAVIENRWPERYGGVVTDSRGIVYGFVPRGSPAAKYHFVGVQMAHPSVFAALPIDEPAESTSAVYRALIAEKPGSIRAFLSGGDFHDVGTPADYLDAALSIGRLEGAASPQIGHGSTVDVSARVADSVLWEDVHVEAGATLERCVVADGVHVPAGRRFSNCAIIQSGGKLVVSELNHG
jgi:NDP-sugar pyrophosphorylase family protein